MKNIVFVLIVLFLAQMLMAESQLPVKNCGYVLIVSGMEGQMEYAPKYEYVCKPVSPIPSSVDNLEIEKSRKMKETVPSIGPVKSIFKKFLKIRIIK